MILFRLLVLIIAALGASAVTASPARAQDEAAETQRLARECNDGAGDAGVCADYGHRLYNAIGTAKDHPAALRLWLAACERGSAVACSNVAVVLRWSDVVPHDLPRALAQLERACSMSMAAACLNAGHMRKDGIGATADGEAARRSYELACTGGNGEGCRLQGRILADGLGTAAKDEPAAIRSLEAGCMLNDMESCALVGYMAASGRGMAANGEIAVRHHIQACQGGVEFACGNMEAIRAAGPGTFGYAELAAAQAPPPAPPEDIRNIVPVMTSEAVAETQRVQQACRQGRGDENACVFYGHYLYNGIGTAVDRPAALSLWRPVCDRGRATDFAFACANTAIALRSPTAGAPDAARALRYAEQACTLGNGSGCLELGYMRRNGDGTPVDGPKALEAFDMACGYDNGAGCREAGMLHSRGILIPRNYEAEVSYSIQGCNLNNWLACAGLGYAAMNGRGMAVDRVRGIKEYKRACLNGERQIACPNLEHIRSGGPGAPGYAELMAYEVVERAFPPTLPLEQRYLLARATLEAGNLELALAGFETLSEQGSLDAAFNLGQIYWNGEGVAQDRPRAVRYLDRASDGGHPYAQYLMAGLYRAGSYVTYSEGRSITLMRAAYEAGGIQEAGPIWMAWRDQQNARFDAQAAHQRELARISEESERAADAANLRRIWGLYSNSQNQQGNGQVCGTIYRNNQAHHECMARETFDNYYNPNR